MTDEQQIKQNAEEYACPENSCLSDMEKERVMTHFIAGAHSRDEEIKELKEHIKNLQDTLQTEQEHSQEYIMELKKEIKCLKDSVIKVNNEN